VTGARSFPLVVAAPSGAGKTSLTRALLESRDDLAFSVSATTRDRRPHERDGVDYHFVDRAAFDAMIDAGEFVEWATVHGERYGTTRAAIQAGVDAGRVVVLDIDIQGASAIRERFAEAVLVFVLPPSGEELSRRLAGRGSEAEAERRRRLINARAELPSAPRFDYVVVNDDFDAGVAALSAIVDAEMLRVDRQAGLHDALRAIDRDIAEILEES
jgi:guanylate kinase